jgi:hypothetical protein
MRISVLVALGALVIAMSVGGAARASQKPIWVDSIRLADQKPIWVEGVRLADQKPIWVG